MQPSTGTVREVERVAIELYEMLRCERGDAAVVHDINPAVLHSSWELLQRLGLGEFDDDAERCIAIEPAVAMARLLGLCRQVLLTREADAAEAVWGAPAGLAPPRWTLDGHAGIRLVTGHQAVAAALADAYRAPVASRFTVHGDSVPEWGRSTRADVEMAGRGVDIRQVYRCRSALSDEQRRHLQAVTEAGVQVRLDPCPPIDLIIVDDASVILPADPDRPGWALVLIDSAVWAHATRLVADQCWDAALDHATVSRASLSA